MINALELRDAITVAEDCLHRARLEIGSEDWMGAREAMDTARREIERAVDDLDRKIRAGLGIQ